MGASQTAELLSRCDLLRSLHRPGAPLLLPNVWDVATARAVVAAGFPVVATGSVGVAAALGYEDHEAPADEMLGAAARIASCRRARDRRRRGRLRDGPRRVGGRVAERRGRRGATRECLPRSRRGLRVPDRPVRGGCAAALHLGGSRPGERGAPAAGAVAGRAGRSGRGPGELGTAAVLGRDGALRGPARLAAGVRSRSTAADAASSTCSRRFRCVGMGRLRSRRREIARPGDAVARTSVR